MESLSHEASSSLLPAMSTGWLVAANIVGRILRIGVEMQSTLLLILIN
jgi:hypothetical protein